VSFSDYSVLTAHDEWFHQRASEAECMFKDLCSVTNECQQDFNGNI